MFSKGAWLLLLFVASVTIATVRASNDKKGSGSKEDDKGNSREDDKGNKPPRPRPPSPPKPPGPRPPPPPKPSPGKGHHGRGDPHDDDYDTVISVVIIVTILFVVIFLLSLLSAMLCYCCCYKHKNHCKPRDDGYRPIVVVAPHPPCCRGDQGGAPPTTHVAVNGYGSFEAGPAPAGYNGGAGANQKQPMGNLPPYSQSAGCSYGKAHPTAPPPSSPPFSSGSKRFKL